MAIRHSNLHPRYIPHTLHKKHLSIYNPKISHFTTNTRFRLQFSITFPRNNHFSLRKFASVNGFSVPNVPEDGARNGGEKNVDFLEIMQRWVIFLQSVCPGGSWWNLYDPNEVEIRATKPITVLDALRRMWGLVENDRWVIFVAFGALIVAALSEISMPSLLAASIFSAQNSDIVVFSRNLRLLVLLCFTSGICSGLRSGCFAIANMILVKRLKETLYAALLFQVAQETFSLMRTVRVYGTDRKELERYKQWLEKLAFISMRESVAYGFWNLSFNTLFRSTQK